MADEFGFIENELKLANLENNFYGPKNRPNRPNRAVPLENNGENVKPGRRIQFSPTKTVRNIYGHGKGIPKGNSHKTKTRNTLYLTSMSNLQKFGIYQDILALLVADASSRYDSLSEMVLYIKNLENYPGALLARYPALVTERVPKKVKIEAMMKLIQKYIDTVEGEKRVGAIAFYRTIEKMERATPGNVSAYINRLNLRTFANKAYATQVEKNAEIQMERNAFGSSEDENNNNSNNNSNSNNNKNNRLAGTKRRGNNLNSGRNNKKLSTRRRRH